MREETKSNRIEIYKTPEGPEIQVALENETVWLTQAQIAELFQTDRSSITKHIRNIIKSSELKEKSNVQNLHIANSDRPVKFYNLDFIISIGYRVNSAKATQFRIWASQRLKELMVKGYSIYKQRFAETQVRLQDLQRANQLFLKVIESRRAEGYEKELLNIITDYTHTWFVLNQYDKGELRIEEVSGKKPSSLDYEEVRRLIATFKTRLTAQKQAGGLFGQEVGNKFQAVLGSINQTFGKKDLYFSMEEKAAHLLYFCIKDHPFADGNKRIGSLMFLLYLVENHALLNRRGERKINDSALTALALLIAESDPAQKDVMIKLVVNLINKK